MRWHCALCDEDEQGFVQNHFRLMHPNEYERWGTEREPAFEIVHYEPGEEDVLCCWTHPTADGEEFREGDVSVVAHFPDGLTARICLACFESNDSWSPRGSR